MAKLNIVLYEPEIPANTRKYRAYLCGNRYPPHLIEPLGFRLNEKQIKRAGMDYWKDLDVTTYVNYQEFLEDPGCKDLYGNHKRTECVYRSVL